MYKPLIQYLSKLNVAICKKDNIPRLVGLIAGMQGWINIWKSVSVIHHIKIAKDIKHNNYIIISTDTEKVFNTIQYSLVI